VVRKLATGQFIMAFIPRLSGDAVAVLGDRDSLSGKLALRASRDFEVS
jgi:hypothetical protein